MLGSAQPPAHRLPLAALSQVLVQFTGLTQDLLQPSWTRWWPSRASEHMAPTPGPGIRGWGWALV